VRPCIALVFTDPPWPPTSGGDLRNAAIAAALARHSELHQIAFPLRGRPDADEIPPNGVIHPTPLPAQLERLALRARGLVSGRHPFLEHLVRHRRPEVLFSDLKRIRPEIVVLTQPLTGPFLEVPHRLGARLIFDLDTSHRLVDRRRLDEARGLATIRPALDLAVASRMERGLDRTADEIWVSSAASQEHVHQQGVALRIVPNVIETRVYARYRRPFEPGLITYVGSFDYGPNLDAAKRLLREILPLLLAAWPGARLRLVGRNPPPSLVDEVARSEGAELIGDAEDPWELMAGHGPIVVPLRSAGGTRLKILQAAASEVPIVATALAAEGLDLKADEHLLIAESDTDLAAAVLRIWRQPGIAGQLTSGALIRVTEMYDLDVLDGVIGNSIERILAKRLSTG
jgi:glycosyltransferase involved in cell wall biosynthesis